MFPVSAPMLEGGEQDALQLQSRQVRCVPEQDGAGNRVTETMKVRIYIQRDGCALVVPLEGVDQTLPPAQDSMRKSAVRIKDADIDDSIIGLDKDAARKSILRKGWFVNESDITISEHSDSRS